MRAILHVGTYKTGTSSIQNLLFRNSRTLLARGVLYPATGLTDTDDVGRRHAGLIRDYVQKRDGLFPETLKAEIAESACHTVIFSLETWSNPRHFPHLSAFSQALIDNGVTDLEAVICLRRIDAYQVSLFRQFTINHTNKLNYPDFVRQSLGMFDYLYVMRVMRSIFGSQLKVLEFDPAQDIRPAVLDQLGLSELKNALPREPYANVRSVSALDVEAIRLCNTKGVSKDAAVLAVRSLVEREPSVGSTPWTERFEGDAPERSPSYVAAVSACSGLDESRVRALLHPVAVSSQNISVLSDKLSAEIESLEGGFPSA